MYAKYRDIDRGPWPVPLGVAAALMTGLAVAAVASLAMNRRGSKIPRSAILTAWVLAALAAWHRFRLSLPVRC